MTIEVVFDGKTFVPTQPVDLPAGTKANVAVAGCVEAESDASPLSISEAERILQGDGTPLPWATVEEALAYSRGRPWPEPDGEVLP